MRLSDKDKLFYFIFSPKKHLSWENLNKNQTSSDSAGGGATLKSFLSGILPVLLIFNFMSLQAQDCIDIEQIKTDLSNIDNECDCADPVVLGVSNQTTNISTYQLGGLVQNKCIEVQGTIVIDEWKTFVGCDFIMSPGAKIKTQGLQLFAIVNSNLHSCGDYLWDGIKLNTGARFSLRGSVFQHSLNGIYSNGGLLINSSMTNNVFNNNHFAVKFDDPLYSIRRTEVLLSGNIFSQSDDLKFHWESPHNKPDFTYGVKTNFAIVNSLVGNDPCNRTNIFIGLNYGYYLKNTIARIHADLFHDFNFNDPEYWSTGIKTEGFDERIGESSLELRGWPTDDIETFNGVCFGVNSTLGYSDIESIIIDNACTGIHLTAPLGNFTIKNSHIRVQKWTGIVLSPFALSYGSILNNIIDVEVDEEINRLSGGIWIQAWRQNSGFSTVIQDNEINLNSGTFGIKSEGPYSVGNRITCNIINILDLHENLSSVSGIEILRGQRNSIVDNEIFGQYSSMSNIEVNGIKIIESPSNYFRGNYTENTQIGMHFSNWNNNTFQDGNTMSNHEIGYYISETGATGHQYYSANKWLGSYGDWGALNDGEFLHSIYNDYQNLLTTTCWPGSVSPDPGWFQPAQGIGFCLDPEITSCIVSQDFQLPKLNYLDTLIARGELEFSDFEEARIWQAERYLLRNLLDYSYLVGGNGTLMDSFINDAMGSSLWQYLRLEMQIEEYSKMPVNVTDLLKNYFTQYSNLKEDTEIAINDWIIFPDSTELGENVSYLNEQIDSIWNLSSSIYQDWKMESNIKLSSLLPHIASLPTPNLYASSEKLIMEAMVKVSQGIDSVGSSMRNSLIGLAGHCMIEYGTAVINARGIVRYLGYDPGDEILNCYESEGYRIVNHEESDLSKYKVFPNPTSNYIHIAFESPVEPIGDLKMYDHTGKLVLSKSLENSSRFVEISINHLPIGSYTISIEINGKLDSQPVIITR